MSNILYLDDDDAGADEATSCFSAQQQQIPPLLGIFFAEFDVHRGTVLSWQVGEELVGH